MIIFEKTFNYEVSGHSVIVICFRILPGKSIFHWAGITGSEDVKFGSGGMKMMVRPCKK